MSAGTRVAPKSPRRARTAARSHAGLDQPAQSTSAPRLIDGATESGARAVSVEVAARLCGLSRSSMYKAVQSGEVRTARIGHRWLVPVSEIERLLAN